MLGKYKDNLPPTGTFLWTDVRDLALAHVRAAERPEAAGKRFFITAGHFSNRQIADIIAKEFPDLREKIAGENVKDDFDPEGTLRSLILISCLFGFIFSFSPFHFFSLLSKADCDLIATYKYDNSQTRAILGIEFRDLKQCVVDTVKSLQAVA